MIIFENEKKSFYPHWLHYFCLFFDIYFLIQAAKWIYNFQVWSPYSFYSFEIPKCHFEIYGYYKYKYRLQISY